MIPVKQLKGVWYWPDNISVMGLEYQWTETTGTYDRRMGREYESNTQPAKRVILLACGEVLPNVPGF